MSQTSTAIELELEPIEAIRNASPSSIRDLGVEMLNGSLRSFSIENTALSSSIRVPPSSDSPSSYNGGRDGGRVTLKRSRVVLVVIQLSAVGFIGSMCSGLLTVGIARMAEDLGLERGLIYWPSSVYGLTSGTCLILAGSLADILGPRPINLLGTLLLSILLLATAFVRTGIELILLRALQGIAISLCLPTAISILSHSTPRTGKVRNLAFACLGLAAPFGFSVGLVLGGVFVDTVGWRVGWWIGGGGMGVLFGLGVWVLPKNELRGDGGSTVSRLKSEVDWVGALIATACLGMFGYVLAMLTSSTSSIKSPVNIVLLAISLVLVPVFAFWVGKQEELGKPALIPNSIWKNSAFSSVCLMLLLSYAVEQTMDLFSSLFFQQVQLLPALQASIRLLPSMALGVVLNFTTGLLVHKVSALYLVTISSVLCAAAPLLMALINPGWPYWYNAFFAQLLEPLSSAFLFTIGILIVSESFPPETQALAGAVFNTVAQFGTSIGLAIIAVISNAVTESSEYSDKTSPEALMVGYRAGFWAAFGLMVVTCFVGVVGLRKVGKVGVKRD